MTRLIDRAREVRDWICDAWRDPVNDLYWRTIRHGVGLMVGIWIGYAVTRPGMAWACWALLALTVLDIGVTVVLIEMRRRTIALAADLADRAEWAESSERLRELVDYLLQERALSGLKERVERQGGWQ